MTTPDVPWFFRKKFIVLAFLFVGPLAFPFFWFSPKFSVRMKIITTIVLSVSMMALTYASGKLMERLMQELQSQGII